MDVDLILRIAMWVGIACGTVVYFLPACIGFNEKQEGRLAIFLVNLLLGWTVIGWIISFVWSISEPKEAQPLDCGSDDIA